MIFDQSAACRKVSFTYEELNLIKRQIIENRPYYSRISFSLAFTLARYPYANSVLDEIDYLEGIHSYTRTKKEKQFRSGLNPFWHKHYMTPRHIIKNIGIRWGLVKKDNTAGTEELDQLCERIAKQYGHSPDLWQKYLVNDFVMGGFNERSVSGFTGDWIIYAKYKGNNYYLCLATHEEGKSDYTDRLLKKIKNAGLAEFPFLFKE